MTRIIIHAGFHKTGTSSLQQFLTQNRAALKPCLDYYGASHFPAAASSSRIYGQRPFPWRRWRFRRALRRFLASIPVANTIVMSRETFAGVMPGHRDILRRPIVRQTPTAIRLAREIIRELKRRFGPDADICLVYTTREANAWIRSVYGHLLRSIHLREDFRTFATGFAIPPNPEVDALVIAAALAPVPVYIVRLEDFADHPEGTAAAILDLANVPDDLRATLHPAIHHNPGQSDEIERRFLVLNRSGQSKAALKSAKDRILHPGTSP